jgi:hypothetical protein
MRLRHEFMKSLWRGHFTQITTTKRQSLGRALIDAEKPDLHLALGQDESNRRYETRIKLTNISPVAGIA